MYTYKYLFARQPYCLWISYVNNVFYKIYNKADYSIAITTMFFQAFKLECKTVINGLVKITKALSNDKAFAKSLITYVSLNA